MFKKGCTMLLIIFGLVGLSTAHASFSFEKKLIDNEPGVEVEKAKNQTVTVTQIGAGNAENKSSFGNKVPLDQAIDLITPDNWDVKGEQEAWQKTVTWNSSKDTLWLDALKQLSHKYNLRFVVDWRTNTLGVATGKKELNRMNQKMQQNKTKADTQAESNKTDTLAESNKTGGWVGRDNPDSLVASKVEEPKKKGDPVTISETPWELNPGSLKKQFSEWSKKAEYNLIWDCNHDYRIDAGQTYYGDFQKAVTKVVKALYNAGARIEADIYKKNRVLYITAPSK